MRHHDEAVNILLSGLLAKLHRTITLSNHSLTARQCAPRTRSLHVRPCSAPLQVVLYCFDCLYLNGDVMLRRPLVERREAMYGAIVPQDGKIQFATTKTSRDIEELQVRCLRAALKPAEP